MEFHNLPGCKCDCKELGTDDIGGGTALLMRTAPTTRGRVAQAVACLGQACEGIGHVAVGFAERIEIEHAPQHGDALRVAEPDTHTPTIETDVDVPVAKVTAAVKIAPSMYATVAFRLETLPSRYRGQWFLRCPRNHCTDDQCSFFRLCGSTTMPTAGGLWLFCLQCEMFH